MLSGWALEFSKIAEEKKRAWPDDIQVRLYRALDLICKNPEIGSACENDDIYFYEDGDRPQIFISYRIHQKHRRVTVNYVDCKIVGKLREIAVFLSYSHKDMVWFQRLRKALEPLQAFDIRLWSDEQISPGQDWHDLIREKLTDTSASLLLVSQSFLESDFICNHELPTFLERAENRNPSDEPFLLLWVPLTDKATIKQHQLGPRILRFQALSVFKRPLSKLWFWQVRRTLRRLRDAAHQAIYTELRRQ